MPARALMTRLGRIGLTLALVAGLVVALLALTAKAYVIPSNSMQPTVAQGERVIAEKLPYWIGDPEVGDIVVFHPPVGAMDASCSVPSVQGQVCSQPGYQPAQETFIKRIVAGPGDTLSIVDGRAVVDGEALAEDYIRPCGGGSRCNFPKEVTIPPDGYFMMGDNRGASDDSRFWGPVPRDWITGKVVAVYWPPDRIGIP